MRGWALLLALCLAGCEQKMADASRRDPFERSPLFADGTSARLPPPGTVAADADLEPMAAGLPATLPMAMLERGRAQYEVFCTPCHDYTGHGNGRVVQRGFPHPPDFHSAALRAAPDRLFFDTITHGYGAMYPYASRVPVADRWAIVAYIRALQLSEDAPAAMLGPELIARLGEVTP
jgi:mono/diheme cytochrome c family protein